MSGAALSLGGPTGLAAIFALSAGAREHAMITALIYCLVGTAAVFSCFGFLSGALLQQVWDTALRDGLTGLFNRRHLMTRLEDMFAQCQRTGQTPPRGDSALGCRHSEARGVGGGRR